MCMVTSSRGPHSSSGIRDFVMASPNGSVAELRKELRDLDMQRKAIEEEVALLSERLNAPGQPGMKGSLLDKQGFPRTDIDVLQVRRDRQRLICLTNDQKALTDKLARLLEELYEAMRVEAAISNGSNGESTATTASISTTGRQANEGAGTTAGGSGAALAATSEPAGVVLANGSAASGPMAAAVNGAGAAAAATAPMDVDGGEGDAAGSTGESDGPRGYASAAVSLVPFALVDEVSAGSPANAAGLQVGDLLCTFGDVSVGGAPAAAAGGDRGGRLLQDVAMVLTASEGRPVAARVLRQGMPLELSLTPARWSGRGLLGCHLQPL